jgi:hypothetical protein
MYHQPKPVIEQRPDLKGVTAIVCEGCGQFWIFLTPGACAMQCYCSQCVRSIHDLDQPCDVCLEASDEARKRRGTIIPLDLPHPAHSQCTEQCPDDEIKRRQQAISRNIMAATDRSLDWWESMGFGVSRYRPKEG